MNNEIKEKEEYEKYARDHRKELDTQEVRLGDVVTVLVGHFAGEKGVIVGMIACDKSDYADPYYEIEMECDVPEEFRVRKTLIGQSSVIGGVEKRYLKVIGNCAPKQPSMEIKVGDKVRVSKGRFTGETGVIVGIIVCGRDYADPYYEVDMDCEVPDKYKCRKSLISQNNVIGGLSAYEFEVIGNRTHTEPTAPTIKAGDFVRVLENLHEPICLEGDLHLEITNIPPYAVSQKRWKVISVEVRRDCAGCIYTLKHDDSFIYNIPEDCVELVQPKEQTEAEEDTRIRQIEAELDEFRKAELDRVLHPEKYRTYEVTIDNVAINWQSYEADLAKEIALKVANKYNDPEEAADYAIKVAKAVVEGLKKK